MQYPDKLGFGTLTNVSSMRYTVVTSSRLIQSKLLNGNLNEQKRMCTMIIAV